MPRGGRIAPRAELSKTLKIQACGAWTDDAAAPHRALT